MASTKKNNLHVSLVLAYRLMLNRSYYLRIMPVSEE